MLPLLILPLLLLTIGFCRVYEEPDGLTPIEKMESSQKWAYSQTLLNQQWISEHPNQPFIHGGIYESSYSLFNKLQMLIITSNLPYDTFYVNEDLAPKLKLTAQKDGEIIDFYYKFHRNSITEPMSDYSWKEYFYSLPNYVKSYSFINGSNSTRTNHFVMFMSYPTSIRTMSNPLFGYTIKTIQLVGPYVDSNEWEITNNVFSDLDLDSCTDFIYNGCTIDVEETLNEWDNILDSTGWSFGIDLSLLVTFSFTGYFCTPYTDYILLETTTSITSKWEYCDYFIEDEKWAQEPCCNTSLSESCNTFKERKSAFIGKDSACWWDFNELKEKKVIKKLQCEYILNDPDTYYDTFKKCPFNFTGIDGLETQEGHMCRILTIEESQVFLDVCSVFLNDNGEVDDFPTNDIQFITSLFYNKTSTIVTENTSENICYSYNGVGFIAEENNIDCKGYVCERTDDKRIYMNLSDALNYCPELATNCSIQPSGCAVGTGIDTESFDDITQVESFHEFISVYDANEELCEENYGCYLKGINTTTNDEYECLSQVAGCIDYENVLFQKCNEATIFSSFFHWGKRNLPLAEKNNGEEVTYNALIDNYEEFAKPYLSSSLMEEVKSNAEIFFYFFNNQTGPFVKECVLVGKYEYNLYSTETEPLTVMTNNRVRTEEYETIYLESSSDSGNEFTYYLLDTGYISGSKVFMGVVEKQFLITSANIVLVTKIWDDSYCVAYDNLDVRVDYNFVIGYVAGDGIQFVNFNNSDNIDLYVGLSEYPTLNFDQLDVFQYPDFILVDINQVRQANGSVDYTKLEVMYLDCLLSHSDENALAFDLEDSYIMCRIPSDVVNTLTEDYAIFPIYRLPKSEISKTYDDSIKGITIAIISYSSVGGLFIIIGIIVLLIFLLYKYKKMKGRTMLKLYDEDQLSSLGGPLILYS
ncbi:Uncharacterized protein QTN25_010423 [Entamoeba marina]